MMVDTIKFSALENQSIFSPKKPPLNRWTNWMPQPFRAIAFAALLLLVVLAFFIFPFFLLAVLGVAFAINIKVGVILLLLLFIGALMLRKRQKRIDITARKGVGEFARQNGWDYGPTGPVIKNFGAGKFVQSATENGATLYSIKGELRGHNFELLVGWKTARNASLEPLTPELFIKSKKKLPKAVLVSRDVTDGRKVFDKMFVAYDKPAPVSLEGDFDKSFQLYVPSGEQVDALSLIAPDFMQAVVTYSSKLTIELSANGFALLPHYTEVLSKQVMIDVFTAAEKILDETDY